MKILFTTLGLIFLNLAFGQSYTDKANTCYNNKDYQCAVDNYLIALDKKLYKENERYLVEYYIGTSYHALKQYTNAEQYFQKALVSKPTDALSNWGLGDTYYNQKKYTEAISQYKKAEAGIANAADKDNINKWIGNAYYRLKDYTNALAAYRKVQSREKSLYDIDASIGNSLLNTGKYDSAIRYYQTAEKLYAPGDTAIKGVRYNMGKAYRLLGQYEQAIETLDALLKRFPAYTLAMWEKGIVYANKKEYSNAIQWYKNALPAYVNDSADYYTLCGNLASCYNQLNNTAEEVNWYVKRKDYGSNKYWDYARIASLQYGALKQPAAAEKTVTEAVNQYQLETAAKKLAGQTSYVKLNSIAGKIALAKKDTAKALTYFEEAIKLDKTSYEANAGAADIAWARKKPDDYKKYYTNIYKTTYDTLLSTKKDIANVYGRVAYVEANINSKQPSAYSTSVTDALSFDSAQKEAALLWPIVLSKGYSYDLTSKRSKCLAVLDKAIKVHATDKEYVSDLYNSKAVIVDQKDTAAIRKALEEAVKIYPENIRPWDNLLKFYTSYDNAKGVVMVDKLVAVLKKQKDNKTLGVALVYKGDFLWRLNKKEEAKKQYAEALVWDADNATAKERIKL